MRELPIIDEEKCDGCGLCVSVCACGALIMVENIIRAVEMDECQWCTLCELVCPTEAIVCPFDIIIENEND